LLWGTGGRGYCPDPALNLPNARGIEQCLGHYSFSHLVDVYPPLSVSCWTPSQRRTDPVRAVCESALKSKLSVLPVCTIRKGQRSDLLKSTREPGIFVIFRDLCRYPISSFSDFICNFFLTLFDELMTAKKKQFPISHIVLPEKYLPCRFADAD